MNLAIAGRVSARRHRGSIIVTTNTSGGGGAVDPRTYDYATFTGPRITPAPVTGGAGNRYLVAAAGSPRFTGAVGVAVDDSFSSVDVWATLLVPATFVDSSFLIPQKWQGGAVSKAYADGLIYDHCRWQPSYAEQRGPGSPVGTGTHLNSIGHFAYCDFHHIIDGAQGLGGQYSQPSIVSTVDRSWVHPQYDYRHFDGYPWNGTTTLPATNWQAATTNAFLTESQQGSVAFFNNAETVSAGAMRMDAGGTRVYQCVQGGTTGTSTSTTTTNDGSTLVTPGASGMPVLAYDSAHPTNWNAAGTIWNSPVTNSAYGPGAPIRMKDLPVGSTCYPFSFTGGTAKWVHVGLPDHSDGLQWSVGGHCAITNSYVRGYTAGLIIQSAQIGKEGYNIPVKLVSIDNSVVEVIDDLAPHWIQVNTANTSLSQYGSTGGAVLPGYYKWAAGVWSVNPTAYVSRPWYVSVTNCYFKNTVNGTVATSANVLTALSRNNDMAIIVPDEATRDAGVAAQYGITIAEAAAMRASDYDWHTNAAALDAALNTTVMNNRLTTFNAALSVLNATDGGAHQGVCDARSWIVWANNKNADSNATIMPATWAGKTGFDAAGYYTGV